MNSESPREFSKAALWRGRIMASAIMLVVALPLVAAMVVYHTGIGMPSGTANEGVLLTPPQPVAQLQLVEQGAAEQWDLSSERRRWRLLVPAFGGCNTQCEQTLFLTRQVHVRLGSDAYRMERFLLLGENEAVEANLATFLEQEHPGLRVMRLAENRLSDLLGQTNLAGSEPVAEGHYYLMDQSGYLMMAYDPGHSGNQLLTDIKRMLKVTYED
ncbi:hypothetical protein [Marinimicrobium sp. ABcell2]|uniref:SCO family protein n=1 Tax=Marinimicrobium sp. ABcell2 TaxID=3069751 RepID=UPI0027B5E5B9|nr:hypothetical protein [Marinimicrobium sp. ABcell2]MDQ2076237.1 hypothetical protein [Marinimicrobium sp. ABcell2]